MKTISFVGILLLLLGFSIPPSAVKLEYSFKVGDEYLITQVTKQTIKQLIMGTDQNGQNEYSGEMMFKVLELTKVGARLETQFLKLRNRSVTLMGDVTMDSDGEETQQNKVLKSMMKKSFVVTMNRYGQVMDVEGADNLWSDVGSLGLDDATQANLKQSLGQFLGKSSLKNSFEQAMVYYSEGKVKEGDKWRSKNAFPMEFPIEVDNSWSLVSINGATAKVNADGIYATTDKEKIISLPNNINAKMDLNGKQTLKSTVSAKTGWPSELQIHSELKGKMILLAGAMLPQDMEVPMEIVTDTTYKISKK